MSKQRDQKQTSVKVKVLFSFKKTCKDMHFISYRIRVWIKLKGENLHLHSVNSKNPETIFGIIVAFLVLSPPVKPVLNLQLSELRPWLLPHPPIGLECRFGALSSLIKRLSSHPVIEYQKEAAPKITGPEFVNQMVSPRRSPIQSLTIAHVA